MSEPENKLSADTDLGSRGTGPRFTRSIDEGLAPESGNVTPSPEPLSADTPLPEGTRLKIVTIAPGRGSLSDAELDTGQAFTRSDPYLGATIDGRYKVEMVLGEGGMGVVYRCSHTIIGKKVAMKVLRADLARDVEVTERFLNEAKAASAIGNPHIIDISDFGQFQDGSTYFVMEYLSGCSLGQALDGGQPIPIPRAIYIARQLAEGLAAAHAAGIVHRDLKPDNIFLIERGGNKDFVKILDFGIAKVSTTSEGKLTRAGAVFGTPHYMSPEQAAGSPVDHRGDIYSLGVILYEMASGRVPFDADNFMGILTQHMYKAPVPIRALSPQLQEVPEGLEAIVLKCLSKRPQDRYQNMGELIADLDALLFGQVPAAVSDISRSPSLHAPADYFGSSHVSVVPPASSRAVSQGGRWRWAAAAMAVAGVLGAGAVVLASKSDRNTAHAPSPANTAAGATPIAAGSDPGAAPRHREVMVAVNPLEAQVIQGDRNLGQSPVRVAVPEGQQVVLQIQCAGYKTATVTLDGSEDRKRIDLVRVVRPTASRTNRAEKDAAHPQSAISTSPRDVSVINPWPQ